MVTKHSKKYVTSFIIKNKKSLHIGITEIKKDAKTPVTEGCVKKGIHLLLANFKIYILFDQPILFTGLHPKEVVYCSKHYLGHFFFFLVERGVYYNYCS